MAEHSRVLKDFHPRVVWKLEGKLKLAFSPGKILGRMQVAGGVPGAGTTHGLPSNFLANSFLPSRALTRWEGACLCDARHIQ
jgi:hypothetical protein